MKLDFARLLCIVGVHDYGRRSRVLAPVSEDSHGAKYHPLASRTIGWTRKCRRCGAVEENRQHQEQTL